MKPHALASLLKNPALGNGTSGLMATLFAALVINPGWSPFAYSEHEHDYDIAAVQTVVTEIVQAESLRTSIEDATLEIDQYTTKIELMICIREGCAYEKSQMKRATARKADLQRKLDRYEARRIAALSRTE